MSSREGSKPTKDEHVEKAKQMAEALAAAAPQAAPTERQVLPIDWSTEPTPAAANGVQVTGNPSQFALIFSDMIAFPGRLSPTGEHGNERARIVSSLRVTPDVYFQMLCAMTNSWNRFVLDNVDPRMRQPRFKLLDGGDTQLYGIKKPADE